MLTSAVLAKIDKGILSNNELAEALAYYNNLEQALSPCPPDYHLVLVDARRKLIYLTDLQAARRPKRSWASEQSEIARAGTFVSCSI